MGFQRTALVTGASKGGLGDHLARELHRRGLRVFATVRTPSKAAHLEALGVEIIQLDVQDSKSILAAAAIVKKATGGRLDILINNSGIGYQGALLDVDLVAAREVFNVNYFGVLEVTRAFTPLLRETKGTVVNIGSIASMVPIPFEGIYNASKAALEQLSAQLRIELAAFDIRVTHVVTGGIKTDFFDHAEQQEILPSSPYYPGRERLGKWVSGEMQRILQRSTPEEFARTVVDNALSSNPASMQWVGHGSWWTYVFHYCLWRNAMDILLYLMKVPNIKKALSDGSKAS